MEGGVREPTAAGGEAVVAAAAAAMDGTGIGRNTNYSAQASIELEALVGGAGIDGGNPPWMAEVAKVSYTFETVDNLPCC